MHKRSSIVLSIKERGKNNSRKFGENGELNSIPVLNKQEIRESIEILRFEISE